MNKNIFLLVISIICFTLAVVFSAKFEAVLLFFTLKLSLGWVLSTILIRLLVMSFFIVGLKFLLQIFPLTEKIKPIWVILIGMGPGFLISFAFFPIWVNDYGMLTGDLTLTDFEALEKSSKDSFQHLDEKKIIAFLDVGCDHCREACRKFTYVNDQNKDLPIYLFFYNDSVYVDQFIEEFGDNRFRGYHLNSHQSLLNFAGFEFPSIFYINEQGECIHHWVGDKLNYTALDYLSGLKP